MLADVTGEVRGSEEDTGKGRTKGGSETVDEQIEKNGGKNSDPGRRQNHQERPGTKSHTRSEQASAKRPRDTEIEETSERLPPNRNQKPS